MEDDYAGAGGVGDAKEIGNQGLKKKLLKEDEGWETPEKHLKMAMKFKSLVANEEFQHILRIQNTNVDGKQKIMFAMTSIKGIGRRFSNIVCKKADVDMNKRYFPGKWAENVIECDAPETTTLLLVGPKDCGKSSLVNRISKVFEHDKFGVDRAQVSYDSSGDGTCFLQEYRIPKHSKSFCLFDTRSLSDDSSENMKDFEKWITEGVRHGDPVIRDSDSASLKSRIAGRELSQGSGNVSKKMVNFVVFVVDGLSVLKSMDDGDDEANRQYSKMILTTFNCPFLSFRGDKPVIAVTHGDLLSVSDRARIRIHLGELLTIHPTKQIFDIPDNYEAATDMAIVDMLRYGLEHADRNLSGKQKRMSLMEMVSSYWQGGNQVVTIGAIVDALEDDFYILMGFALFLVMFLWFLEPLT